MSTVIAGRGQSFEKTAAEEGRGNGAAVCGEVSIYF
jgi:hypothetical protein